MQGNTYGADNFARLIDDRDGFHGRHLDVKY
jgi:hypothetical protein